MDWLGIIVAIVLFSFSAILEKDKKKKKKSQRRVQGSSVPEYVPEPERHEAFSPAYEYREPESFIPAGRNAEPENVPAADNVHAAPENVEKRKRRKISGREMVLNSELLKPKYLER